MEDLEINTHVNNVNFKSILKINNPLYTVQYQRALYRNMDIFGWLKLNHYWPGCGIYTVYRGHLSGQSHIVNIDWEFCGQYFNQ